MFVSSFFSLLSGSGHSGKLSVLAFHKVPQHADVLVPQDLCLDHFEQILIFLKRYFRVLPLSDAVKCLAKEKLPSRAVSLTFDDGYSDWHLGLTALLRRHQAPATFFITTGQLDGEALWHERITAAVRALPDEGARLPESLNYLSDLTGLPTRQRLVTTLQDTLKYYDLPSRTRAIDLLESQAVKPLDVVRPYTSEQVLELHRQGFTIGAHTVRHPILNKCSIREVREELGQSRETLEGIIKEPVEMFAYPNGRPRVDYGAEHVAMVREAGYKVAVSTARGAASSTCDFLQLPRFSPWGRSRLRMALQLSRNMTVDPPMARMQKRVVMVAFHFPPQAGSSGVLRTLNFVKHLPRHAWNPVVLTAHPRAYIARRDDLVKMIPAATRVIRSFALDAARHLSVYRKYPRLLALPDRWSTWWFAGFLAGMRVIRQEDPEVIWSTYPIASAHLIAATLARASGLPWVADFRDPMINVDEPSDPLQRKSWEWLEAHVAKNATCCVFTTERAAAVYRSRYPRFAAKMCVIENGYDEDAFVNVAPVRQGVGENAVLLLHSGIIYPKERDPSAFFEALSRMIAGGRADRTRLCVRFRAAHHTEEVEALAVRYGLGDVIDVAPPIPYRDAIAEMLGADFLLAFQGENFNAQIPAKIYEYLRARRPLLALVDPAGDTALQLRPFKAVRLANIKDVREIQDMLEECLAATGSSVFQEAVENDWPQVSRYSRAAQAQMLSTVLDSAIAFPP